MFTKVLDGLAEGRGLLMTLCVCKQFNWEFPFLFGQESPSLAGHVCDWKGCRVMAGSMSALESADFPRRLMCEKYSALSDGINKTILVSRFGSSHFNHGLSHPKFGLEAETVTCISS